MKIYNEDEIDIENKMSVFLIILILAFFLGVFCGIGIGVIVTWCLQ